MNIGSLTDRLLQFCLVLVGRFRGGLGHVNVVANMIFAGMSGSAIADAVGIGRIIIGMMTQGRPLSDRLCRRDHRFGRDHRPDHSAIDPDGALRADFRHLDRLPVPRRLRPRRDARHRLHGHELDHCAAPQLSRSSRRFRRARSRASRSRAFPALMLPVILLFGIYGGVMTPTEGAAAAAFYALFASTVLYRAVTWRQLYDALLTSGKATTSIGMLIAGALVFNYVVTIENIPASLARMLAGQDFSAAMFLLVVNIILLILGCLLEGSTILLVVVPIFIPTAKALGIDLVHFGVVVVVNIMIGLLTPPYGLLAVRARQHDQAAAGRDRARGGAVHRDGDHRARDHHRRSGLDPVAAAADGIQRLRAYQE